MRIAIISTHCGPDGAAGAARRLHGALRRLGHESHLLVRDGADGTPAATALRLDTAEPGREPDAWDDAHQRLVAAHLADPNGAFSLPGPGYDLASHPLVRGADVVNLHASSGLVSPETVQGLVELDKPIVWTLHDHRAFTGGCHDPLGCTRFETDCAGCPQLRGDPAGLASRILSHALQCSDHQRLTVVSSSPSLARDARRSRRFGASQVRTVPPAVEATPADSAFDDGEVRGYLGLFEELVAEARQVSAPGVEHTTSGTELALRPVASFLGVFEPSTPSPLRASSPARRTHRPDRLWSADVGREYRPSWSGTATFLGPEHEAIWEATKALDGWQEPADSQKLYELAFHAGAVILEIGVYAGRSAVVELRGALASTRPEPPQYYGVDLDPAFVARSLRAVEGAGVAEHCLFYTGDLEHFLSELPIVPTMVFVDGDHRYEGVKRDLERLASLLPDGTPVLCHDYLTEGTGVRRAVDEAVAAGQFLPGGLFGCSCLLVARGNTEAEPLGLAPATFARTRRLPLGASVRAQIDWRRSAGGALPARGPWPYAAPPGPPLPATLPDGRPWPKISIVTPSYNQGAYLEQTILSVLNQGYPALEHIVMDGGSTDETAAVLARYRDRLAVCRTEPDRGQSHALNKGFACATGEILTWVNSDDMLAPGALAAIALAFHESRADMVAGICEIYTDGELTERHLTSCRDGQLPLGDLLDLEGRWLQGQFFYQPEVFFRRELWERAGGFVDGALHYSMDYDLWVRFALAGAELRVIGRPVAHYRSHAQQKTALQTNYRPELTRVRDRYRAQLRAPTPPAAAPAKPKKRLRVVMLNDVGLRYGAGIAHGRIARALAGAGHDVVFLAWHDDRVAGGQRPDPGLEARLLQRLGEIEPDVVVVGNVHCSGFEPRRLADITAAFPTVFVLHDEWLLTGRCAYHGSCDKHLAEGCDETCPTATEYPALKPAAIHDAWKVKRHLLETPSKLVLAGNSRWMVDEIARVADASGCLPNAPARSHRLLHFGVPLDTFRPRDKSVSRELLGLPQERFIILFSSTSLSDRRKGLHHLVDALEALRLPNVLPVAIGAGQDGKALQHLDVHFTGYIQDEHTLALLYSAADLFIAPSLGEAFGQVLIEAAACGTPSVGYAVGGIPDALLDGVSGRLCRTVSADGLADAIAELYWNPDLRANLGAWGRLHVTNEFSFERSYHHAHATLRDVLAHAGVELSPKISFEVAPPALLDVEHLLKTAGWHDRSAAPESGLASRSRVGSQEPVETLVLRYFAGRLDRYRDRRGGWYLRPGAWLAWINRRLMRNETARRFERGRAAPPKHLENIVLRYFVERLQRYRAQRTPWYLSPGAWLAWINRRVVRKELARAIEHPSAPPGWASARGSIEGGAQPK